MTCRHTSPVVRRKIGSPGDADYEDAGRASRHSLDAVLDRPEGGTMRTSRHITTLSAVLVASAAGSGLNTTGAAAPAKPASQPRHLAFVADHHTERESSKGIVFTERLRRRQSVVGTVAGRCSYAGLHEGDAVPCTLEVRLPGGTILIRGKLVPNAPRQKLSIVGGTGSYAGATGTAASLTLSKSRTKLLFTIA
jgi:hypothetical protein